MSIIRQVKEMVKLCSMDVEDSPKAMLHGVAAFPFSKQ